MSDAVQFALQFGPRQMGADVLVHIAQQRLTGTLQVMLQGQPRRLHFKGGRPLNTDGAGELAPREKVVADTRAVALLHSGRCALTALEGAQQALERPDPIDTLGEVLFVLVNVWGASHVETVVAARGAQRLQATAAFDRLRDTVAALGGARVEAPPGPATLAALCAGAEPQVQRALITLCIMGGLRAEGAGLRFEEGGAAARAAATGGAARGTGPAPASVSPLSQEIERALQESQTQDHYAFLGVQADAPVDAIRKAYFEHAKRWHTDRLVGQNLSPELLDKAAQLFGRAELAQRVLTNEEERKNYDWQLDRSRQGLPTDPQTVLEAETLYRKGEALLRRGQVTAAEPMLRRAVAINRGEAEFWAALGFAVYSLQGSAGLPEAETCLKTALGLREVDTVYEFRGRIYHSEGQLDRAKEALDKAIELNPKNTSAERELRLIELRREQQRAAEESPFATITGLFNRGKRP